MSSLEPYRHRPLDRPTARELSALDRRVEIAHAHNRAEAEIAAGRITDLTKVTRHGIGAAALIALEAEQAAQLSPWAASQLEAVARAGVTGIRSVIIDLASEF